MVVMAWVPRVNRLHLEQYTTNATNDRHDNEDFRDPMYVAAVLGGKKYCRAEEGLSCYFVSLEEEPGIDRVSAFPYLKLILVGGIGSLALPPPVIVTSCVEQKGLLIAEPSRYRFGVP